MNVALINHYAKLFDTGYGDITKNDMELFSDISYAVENFNYKIYATFEAYARKIYEKYGIELIIKKRKVYIKYKTAKTVYFLGNLGDKQFSFRKTLKEKRAKEINKMVSHHKIIEDKIFVKNTKILKGDNNVEK